MKLSFVGHDYKYAVEQMMLVLFPDQRPEYETPLPADEDTALVTLIQKGNLAHATCQMHYDGKQGEGEATADLSACEDEVSVSREIQKAIRLSFFNAATAITGRIPPWGALTGIRPAHMVTRMIKSGMTEAEADAVMENEYFVSRQRRDLCMQTAKASMAAKAELLPNEISLYVGIPFCPTRCAYCSFVSASVEKTIKLIAPYVDALCDEVESSAKMVRELGLKIKSVYIGGGTPTTLSAPQLERLLTKLETSFDLSALSEYTVEAGRPDTVTAEKLAVLKSHAVTRISINPQTMEDNVLAAIGRRHSAEDVVRAMGLAKASGIPHINMDLIAGLPEDTAAGFRRTLCRVMEMNPDNITIHTLALKKGSRILLDGLAIPSADTVADMLDYAAQQLSAGGYSPYYLYRQKYMSGNFENVGWCKEGCEGLYNIYIMEELQSILSLGAGGSTKMVESDSGYIERAFNLKYPNEYITRKEKIKANQEAFAQFFKQRL